MYFDNSFDCEPKLITGNREIDESCGRTCAVWSQSCAQPQLNLESTTAATAVSSAATPATVAGSSSDFSELNRSPLAKQKRIRFYKRIGGGYYSNVYKAYLKRKKTTDGTSVETTIKTTNESMQKIVVKIVDYDRCTKKSNYENELEISLLLKNNPHRNVVTIVDIIDRPREQFWILMERDSQSKSYDLDNFLRKFPEHSTGERLGQELFRQLTTGLQYLHSLNIVHRDIKPENILIKESHEDSRLIRSRRRKSRSKFDDGTLDSDIYCVKLIDFGFGKIVEKCPESERAICMSHKGTLEFMAPELLVNCFFYDAIKADIYSLGVILYLILFGSSPFQYQGPEYPLKTVLDSYYQLKKKPIFPELSESQPPIKQQDQSEQVKNSKVPVLEQTLNKIAVKPEVIISIEAKRLIQQILHFEPKNRLTLEQILTDNWLNSVMMIETAVETNTRTTTTTTSVPVDPAISTNVAIANPTTTTIFVNEKNAEIGLSGAITADIHSHNNVLT